MVAIRENPVRRSMGIPEVVVVSGGPKLRTSSYKNMAARAFNDWEKLE
jgi:hypothetical protein